MNLTFLAITFGPATAVPGVVTVIVFECRL